MTAERLAVIMASLDKRQPDLTVVMENVRKPHNLAAVARTLEAVGGLEIHAISSLPSLRLTQMAAGGIRKWITVRRHTGIEQGLNYLKQQDARIIATTLDSQSRDFREIDYTKPVAILVGEEHEGISKKALQMADETINIPMAGLVQSLNVSVASALILYEAYRQREAAGMYNQCSLDTELYNRLLFEACHPKVAAYCNRKKIPYPAIDENAGILEPIADSTTYSDNGFAEWMRKLGL